MVEAFVVNVKGAANADKDGLLQASELGWLPACDVLGVRGPHERAHGADAASANSGASASPSIHPALPNLPSPAPLQPLLKGWQGGMLSVEAFGLPAVQAVVDFK